MLPAHQCLGAGDLLAADMHLGLILQEHLAIGDRAGKFTHQRQTIERQIGARQIEHHDLLLAARLIERRFGGLGEADIVAILARRHRHAELHLKLVRLAIEIERTGQCLAQPIDVGGAGFRGVSLEADFDQGAAGGEDSDVGKHLGDSRRDVENQRVGTRPAEVAAQSREIENLTLGQNPPIARLGTDGRSASGQACGSGCAQRRRRIESLAGACPGRAP